MTFQQFFGRLERLSGVAAPSVKLPRKLAIAGSGLINSLYGNWGKTSPIEPSEVERAEFFWYFESAKAQEYLNFEPRDPQETLQDTITCLRENLLGEGVFSM